MADASIRVDVLALGGTIASKRAAGGDGVVPRMSGEDILAATPGLEGRFDIRALTLCNLPSVELDLDLLSRVAAFAADAEAAGSSGLVVLQGTDTIEETSYVLHLLHAGRCPIVVTGAMRHPSQPGADGPANVLDSINCAAHAASRDVGVVVVMNGEVHAATDVQKRHASALGAFWSPSPLGHIAEGGPHIRPSRPRPPALVVPPNERFPFVPILKPGLCDPPYMVDAAMDAGAAAMVVELAGGGHATATWADALGEAAKRVPVIFASRTRGGHVLKRTYGQAGGEIDLIRRGLVPAENLDALKARLLIGLLVMAGRAGDFSKYATPQPGF